MNTNVKDTAVIEGTGGRYTIDRRGNVYDVEEDRYVQWYARPFYPAGERLVNLKCDGKYSTKTVQSLLASAFLPGGRRMHDSVIFKNGDVTDVRLENLAWRSLAGLTPTEEIDLTGYTEVPGTDGQYLISPEGPLYSRLRRRILNPAVNSQGYHFYTVTIDGQRRQVAEHRLLAITFVPGRSESHTHVSHINGDRYDNRPENLRWTAKAESSKKPTRIVAWSVSDPSKRISFPSMAEAARVLGVNAGGISQVCHHIGGCKQTRGYCFEFAER